MLTYAIPAALSFLVTYAIYLIKRDRLALEFELDEFGPVAHEEGEAKFFRARIRNTGNKPLSDITFKVTFAEEVAESVLFSDPTIQEIAKISRAGMECVVPFLNPSDSLDVTIGTKGMQRGVAKPEIVARCQGATARPRPDSQISPYIMSATAAMLSAVVTMGFFLWLQNRREQEIRNAYEAQMTLFTGKVNKISDTLKAIGDFDAKAAQERPAPDSPDTPQVIFAALNRAGLGHLFADLARGGEPTYWRTAVYLMNGFLVKAKDGPKYIQALTALAGVQQIAPSSRGFILYLLAKMEQSRGNGESSRMWFERCRTETPEMHKFLMEQDSSFDLALIRANLSAH